MQAAFGVPVDELANHYGFAPLWGRRTSSGRRDLRGQVREGVRQVGVHLAVQVGVARQHAPERVDVGPDRGPCARGGAGRLPAPDARGRGRRPPRGTQAHRRWVNGLTWPHPADRVVVDDYLLAIDHLEARLMELDAQLATVATTDPYREPVGWLRCFRGIDTLTAMLLLAELHDVQRFPTARALMAYLELVPRGVLQREASSLRADHEDGQHCGSSRILAVRPRFLCFLIRPGFVCRPIRVGVLKPRAALAGARPHGCGRRAPLCGPRWLRSFCSAAVHRVQAHCHAPAPHSRVRLLFAINVASATAEPGRRYVTGRTRASPAIPG